MERNRNILLLNSDTDRDFASALERIFIACGFSLWRFEGNPGSSRLENEIRSRLARAKCVVFIMSRNSREDSVLLALALEAVNRHTLFPIRIDDSSAPDVFRHLQVQKVAGLDSWDYNPDEGLYQLLSALRKATGKKFRLELPLRERNKQAAAVYVKQDGRAYQYYGSGTTTWLANEAARRQLAPQSPRQPDPSDAKSDQRRSAVSRSRSGVARNRSTTRPRGEPGTIDPSKPPVFISYCRKDRRVADRLDSICRTLGLGVWWDEDIPLGENWEGRIKERLDSAACILVIWSRNSVLSDWVLLEARAGLENGALLGLKIDGCTIPEPYSSAETFDLGDMEEGLTINDPTTRDLLRRIEHRTGTNFMSNFERDPYPFPSTSP